MQKIPDQVAAAKLYEIMIKKGIRPDYKVVDSQSQTGTHRNNFVMRVECPIECNGPIFIADGSGKSKKEAKHQAALAFMEKYNLADKNNNPTVILRTTQTLVPCTVNVSNNNRNTVLQTICSKYDLGQPEYEEIGMRGPPHSRQFTICCKVLDLSTNGEGATKSEAKLQATTKMIQTLMQEMEVFEIFESPNLMVSAPSRDIICLSDNIKVPQSVGSINIFGRRNSSSDMYPDGNISSVHSSTAGRRIDKQSIVNSLINGCQKVERNAESSDDSASNVSVIDFGDDCEKLKGGQINKTKSKSLNNLTDSIQLSRNSTLLEAINKINSTLENVEKQLYSKILDTLENPELPRQKTVTFLSHDFQIFINNESPPKIFERSQKCDDPSIRISALTKLLVDLKDHAQKDCNSNSRVFKK